MVYFKTLRCSESWCDANPRGEESERETEREIQDVQAASNATAAAVSSASGKGLIPGPFFPTPILAGFDNPRMPQRQCNRTETGGDEGGGMGEG